MKKLLIICGPTATGKTGLGLKLAKKFGGEIISADSRQIYRYMDVITGKDLPVNVKTQNSNVKIGDSNIECHVVDSVKIWGYDLVNPDEEFSVSHYAKIASTIIKDIYERNKLPIVVGGTGFYIDSLVKPLSKIDIPVNKALRNELEGLGVNQLYRKLLKENPQKALQMNPSDRSNPRRLIRAIEIAENGISNETDGEKPMKGVEPKRIKFNEILWIGLNTSSKENLNERIDKRVSRRLGKQLDSEMQTLKKKDLLRYMPSKTLGYAQWIKYMKGEITKQEAIDEWKIVEHQYAKRQLTWFKKNEDVNWFDITQDEYAESVDNMVQKWYSSGSNGKTT